MALREFTDARGNAWRVWETRPTSHRLRPEFASGWLTFEQGAEASATARRRLAPIPDGWVDLPEEDLRRLCLTAARERPRQRLMDVGDTR
jgi:hypothetical protein